MQLGSHQSFKELGIRPFTKSRDENKNILIRSKVEVKGNKNSLVPENATKMLTHKLAPTCARLKRYQLGVT